MTARALVFAALAVPLLGGGAPSASPSAETAWVHVRLDEPAKQSRLCLNLPLPAVEAALKAAPDSIAVEGGTPITREMDLDRLRRRWKELETTGNAEIVSFEEGEARESVSKMWGRLLIHLQDDRESRKIDLAVPEAVVDALFSGAGQELNIRAAVPYLRTMRGDLLRVHDRGLALHVWIDGGADVPEGK